MTTASLPYFDLDDINLEERIGRGNFSVYKATVVGKPIAVKKMDCDKNQIPCEVEVHYTLPSHPNILPLLGITHSKDGFSIYICMELADKSLYHYLHTERKKPSFRQSSKWALQIARGIHHLHQHGLAHCDLKSANVLLFEKEDTAKVCDFGSARFIDHTTTISRVAGTYRWMAPECDNRANTKVNQRCDVFSYGMILYEVFAHEVPFVGVDDAYVSSLIRDGKRPPIPSELPMHIKELMLFCCKHKPYDRPTFEYILQVYHAKDQLN